MSAARARTEPDIKLVTWSTDRSVPALTRFLKRAAVDPKAEEVARRVLEDIRRKGDSALVRYIKEFDGATLKPSMLAVTNEDIQSAREQVDREFRLAAGEALQRIMRFSRASMRRDWTISSPKGGQLGERFVPIDRVGAYIPGGTAPLASTALMTVALARVAEVPEIVACTPSDKKGRVNPYLLYALDLAGATEIYRAGGIQAIGAMAYGTKTIAGVQKIVGPGGPYVTAAKRLVYGQVAIDMVAGPSELAIVADDSASPSHVAADLLSQAEHGTGQEKIMLVTSSMRLAEAVRKELLKQSEYLERRETVIEVLKKGTLLVVVETLDIGMDLVNQFAPEHLELVVREPRSWLKKVRSAGAVFVGQWTPECAGDFAAGPSHVLPTGGTASMFSGLTVDDFRKRMSVMLFTSADLKEVMPVIQAFSRVEGLDAHARSAMVRFDRK